MLYPYDSRFRLTSSQGARGGSIHNGVDLVGNDKYIVAVCGGDVIISSIITDKSNSAWEFGNRVVVRGDDGKYYMYCHLSKRLIESGAKVRAGDHIGIEGSTGLSTGSHLHFEVRDRQGAGYKCFEAAGLLGINNSVGIYGNDYEAIACAEIGFDNNTRAKINAMAKPFAAAFWRKLWAYRHTK